jgi:hypothetical protein
MIWLREKLSGKYPGVFLQYLKEEQENHKKFKIPPL